MICKVKKFFLCVFLALCVFFGQAFANALPSSNLYLGELIGAAMADALAPKPDRTVYNAEDLQKAFDDGIANIMIGASIKGNFFVPRWVRSISGTGKDISISPADENKPAFEAESTASRRVNLRSTADTLAFYDMTVVCGRRPGIDMDWLSKPVTLKNVAFVGARMPQKDDKFTGCYPSTNTIFESCSFENLTWGIYAMSTGSDYDVTIKGCSFKNVGQAFSANKASSGAKARIIECKGERLGFWVILHDPESKISVTVDQATLDATPGSNFWHRTVEGLKSEQTYNDSQFSAYLEELNNALSKLPDNVINALQNEGSFAAKNGWDAIRISAVGELQRRLPRINFQDNSISHQEMKEEVERCVALYGLLASAPVSEFLTPHFDIKRMEEFCEREIRDFVKDKNLVSPVRRMILGSGEDLAVLGLASNIEWGNTGNVREALAAAQNIDALPDRLFRENIHRLQDWLSALAKARNDMMKLKEAVMLAFPDDLDYVAKLDKTLRNIYDLGVISNRVTAAIFFDLPMDMVFVVNYAKIKEEKEPNRIIQIAREIGPFYSVSQRLCVLRRTNTLRAELDKLWKEALTESHWYKIGDDHSKYETLKSYLGTDSDLMRDAARLEAFFKEWR